MNATDPHSQIESPSSGDAKASLPYSSDLRHEAKYIIGNHRITVGRKTRGSKGEQHFVSGVAFCSCGWSSPTHISNSRLIDDIWEHTK